MTMQATVTSRVTYDVTVGDALYVGLRKVSEWNGLWELRAEGDADGVRIIIAAPPAPSPGDAFQNILNGRQSEPQEVTVISASPQALARAIPPVKY